MSSRHRPTGRSATPPGYREDVSQPLYQAHRRRRRSPRNVRRGVSSPASGRSTARGDGGKMDSRREEEEVGVREPAGARGSASAAVVGVPSSTARKDFARWIWDGKDVERRRRLQQSHSESCLGLRVFPPHEHDRGAFSHWHSSSCSIFRAPLGARQHQQEAGRVAGLIDRFDRGVFADGGTGPRGCPGSPGDLTALSRARASSAAIAVARTTIVAAAAAAAARNKHRQNRAATPIVLDESRSREPRADGDRQAAEAAAQAAAAAVMIAEATSHATEEEEATLLTILADSKRGAGKTTTTARTGIATSNNASGLARTAGAGGHLRAPAVSGSVYPDSGNGGVRSPMLSPARPPPRRGFFPATAVPQSVIARAGTGQSFDDDDDSSDASSERASVLGPRAALDVDALAAIGNLTEGENVDGGLEWWRYMRGWISRLVEEGTATPEAAAAAAGASPPPRQVPPRLDPAQLLRLSSSRLSWSPPASARRVSAGGGSYSLHHQYPGFVASAGFQECGLVGCVFGEATSEWGEVDDADGGADDGRDDE